jgi:hypothetical protein
VKFLQLKIFCFKIKNCNTFNNVRFIFFVAGYLLAIRAGGGGQDHLDHEAVHAPHLPSLLPHLQDTRQGNLTIEMTKSMEQEFYRRTALILMSLAPTREY